MTKKKLLIGAIRRIRVPRFYLQGRNGTIAASENWRGGVRGGEGTEGNVP
jgi:hypothetical protein